MNDILTGIFDNTDNHAAQREAKVWPVVLDIFMMEIERGIKLKNEKVADAVRAMIPGARTSAKSVASYRSKNKEEIRDEAYNRGLL